MLGAQATNVAMVGAIATALVMALVVWRRTRGAADSPQQSRLQIMMDLVGDAVVIMNAAGEIVSWNFGATAVFGYEVSEALGSTIWSMMPAGYENQYAGFFNALADGTLRPPRHPVEIVSMRRDGSSFPTELSVSTWKVRRDGYVLCIFRDVSERRRMEAELRASTELFHGVLEGASETAIIATDELGVITVFNRGAQQLLGYGEAEACGSLDLTRLHDPAELVARAARPRRHRRIRGARLRGPAR